MLYPPAEKLDGLILWNGNVEGPKVAPGIYKASLLYGKDSADISFEIKGDPNYLMTEQDYDLQVGMLLQIRDKFSDVQKAIKNIRILRSQIIDLTSRMDTANAKDIKRFADSINKQMTNIEETLYQTKSKSGQDVLNFPIRLNDKISGLYDVAASGYHTPSKQVKEAFAVLSAQVDLQLNRLKKIVNDDLKELNKQIHDKQVPVIGLKKSI